MLQRLLRRLVPPLAVLVLAACTTTVAGEPTIGVREQRGPAGAVQPGLEDYYGQPVTWSDCRSLAYDEQSRRAFTDPAARCARVRVPLAYGEPDGRTITIGVLRIPATGEREGSVLVNPGGPGVSGMVAVASLADGAEGTALGERYDLIGFDPRGIGVSEPLIRCLTDAEIDADRIEPAEDTVAEVEAENREYAAKCVERSGGEEVLANVGTRDVVRDMDVLRSVLGDEKLTYLGYSYGTRIGTAYAEAFPDSVRAMVLDGAVDPTQDPVEQAIGQANGFDDALDAYFDGCPDRRGCVVRSKAELLALVERTEDDPLPAGARSLSASDTTTAIAAALYDDRTWGFLDSALAAAQQGDGSALMLLADAYMGRDEDGDYTNTLDALTAIRCVDEPRTTDRAEVERQAAEIAEATEGSFLTGTDEPLPALDVCAFWPVPNTSEPHVPRVEGLPTLLVVSTTGDPATPYQAGVDLAEYLSARLLTYEATQHTAFLQGDPCVDEAGIAYLADLELPDQDITC